MSELLPCPFCGEAPELLTQYGFHVECQNDKYNVFAHTVKVESVDDAIEAWNTRAESASDVEMKKQLDEYRIEASASAQYIQWIGHLLGCADGDDTPEIRIAEMKAELQMMRERLAWLHDCSTGQYDPEGYEWGIYRVKWENGQPVSIRQTNSDFSDLDAEMLREKQASLGKEVA